MILNFKSEGILNYLVVHPDICSYLDVLSLNIFK